MLSLITHQHFPITWSRCLKLCLIILGAGVFERMIHVMYRKYRKFPAGPVGIPFFGSIFPFVATPLSFMLKQPTYGKISYFNIIGTHNVVINDTKLISQLCCKNELMYRPNFGPYFIGHQKNLTFTNNLSSWKKRRAIFRQHLISPLVSSLKSNQATVNAVQFWDTLLNQQLIKSFNNCITNNNGLFDTKGSVLYTNNLSLNQMTLHISFNVIFQVFNIKGTGSKVSMSDIKLKQVSIKDKTLNQVCNVIFEGFLLFNKIMAINSLPILKYILGDTDIMDNLRKHNALMDRIYDEYKGSTQFIKELILNNETDNDDQDVIKADISTMFHAGMDTTGNTLELAILILAKNRGNVLTLSTFCILT